MATHQPDTHTDGILSSLTDSQQEAVRHVDGPLLILAGPGSGKTRVVTHRIAYLLQQGIPDHQIIALTFTNKAAEEMRARLDQLVPDNRVWLGTFHRFCARLLRRYASLVGLHENFSIIDVEDSQKLLKAALDDAQVELIHESPARIASAISWAKNDVITAEEYRASRSKPVGSIVRKVYPHYQRRLLEANAVDFDDLLLHVAVMLRDNDELRQTLDEQFRYILVDEYQDTNLAQYAIVRALSVDYPNLAATGDPDQSIYGWRGATIRNILDFEREFRHVKVVRLEQNYRSTKRILRAADQLIAHNAQRKEKALYTDNPDGKPVRIMIYPTGRLEAEAIAAKIANEVAAGLRSPKDYAIFYRANFLSRPLERALRTVGIPYQIVRGLEFYQRQEIKDILAYLHLWNNPANDVALLRIINTPPRRIGKTTVKRIAEYARRKGMPLLEAARQAGMIDSLSKRTAVEVAKFVAMFDRMQMVGGDTLEEIIGSVLHHSKYGDWLLATQTEEDRQRLDNIAELLTDAREFDETHHQDGGLEAFLEQASLVTDIDDWNTGIDRVTMMTLHAAKGLEFPVVFIVAVEEKMLPHERVGDDPDKLEEERRLLFVGMTRAEEELQLSAAQVRTLWGSRNYVCTSEFLLELPLAEMEVLGQLGYDGSEVAWEPDVEPEWSDGELAPPTQTWDDDSVDDPERPVVKRKKGRRAGPAKTTTPRGPFVTAADMMGVAAPEKKSPPDAFRHGMVVTHPEYGLGKVVALGGSGEKRTATVQFASEENPKRFRLAFSQLRPAKG